MTMNQKYYLRDAGKVGQASSLSGARVNTGKNRFFSGDFLTNADRLEACPTLAK
jgi:hypothetical protein